MIKTNIWICILCLLLATCQTGKESTSDSQGESQRETITFPEVNDQFDTYLNHFEKSSLPIEIKGCKLGFQGLKKLDVDQFAEFIQDVYFSYKQIPTPGNYIATLSLGAADCLLPVLTTYNLSGKKIDQKTLAIGYCRSGCGYQCAEYMTIKSDFVIYVSDTISSSSCDSLGNIIPGTTQNYIISKTGYITEQGHISLGPEKRIDLAQ